MNRLLPESVVRAVCRELLGIDAALSGRGLTRELRARFGAVGRAERVFRIWRQESEAMRARVEKKAAVSALPTDIQELQRRLDVAEQGAAEMLARAERAELREQAHQDHWALEIDRLRQEIALRAASAVELRNLRAEVMRLTAELAAARTQLR
jgi:hypothetical protein